MRLPAVRLPMETEGEWLAIGRDGWALWHHPEASSVAFIRLVPEGPGIPVPIDEVRFVRLNPPDRLQANDLRLLALGRVQSMASDPDVEPLVNGSQATDHLPVLDPAKVSAQAAKAECEQIPERSRTSPLKISVPPKGQRDMYFYEILDMVYRRAASQSSHPAKDIADANGVPVSTVHSWLKAMRKRQAEYERQRGQVPLEAIRELLSQLPPNTQIGTLRIEEKVLGDGSVQISLHHDPPQDT